VRLLLTEILNTLISDLKTEFTDLEKVDKYRGEFNEDTDWNPTSTACFLQVVSYKPLVKHADSTFKPLTAIRIYAGANTKHNQDALAIAEDVINYLNSSILSVTIGEATKQFHVYLGDEGMDFINYIKGFEAYTFLITVI
jgi:hypothetical protein